MTHLGWFGLQHNSESFICPHLVQIAASLAPLGMLQQPGEAFTRLHLEHISRVGLQQMSLPCIWPHLTQSATLSAAFAVPAPFSSPDSLQPFTYNSTPNKTAPVTIIKYFLFNFMISSF
jgi:hypothetical protein